MQTIPLVLVDLRGAIIKTELFNVKFMAFIMKNISYYKVKQTFDA